MPIDWSSCALSFGNPVGQMRCEPGWRLDQAWSDRLVDFDLWFVWAGRGRMMLSDRTLDLQPGVCLWMRPGRRYIAEQHPRDRLGASFVHFDLVDRRSRVRLAERDLPPEVHHVDVVYVHALLRKVVDFLTPVAPRAPATRSHEHAIAIRLFEGVLMQLDLAAGDPSEPASARRRREIVHDAATFIRNEPGRSWKVAELARRVGYGPDHFARLFKEILGINPQDFIVETRLERARQLLAESSLTIGQIADALGYSSPYFFARQVRQRTGLSPSQHRRRERQR